MKRLRPAGKDKLRALEAQVLELLNQAGKRPCGRREIAEQLGLRGGERKQLTRLLDALVRDQLIEMRKGRYRIGSRRGTAAGEFSRAEQGYGFLRPDNGQADLFIPARHVGTAMDGDRVLVSRLISTRDGRPYGKVVRILGRAHRRLVGQYRQRGKTGLVWPLNRKLDGPVRIEGTSAGAAGEVVEVEIERYADGDLPAAGRIVARLGSVDDPQVDIETIIRSHHLPHRFPPAALAAADRVPAAVDPEDTAGRRNLRDLPLVTIDGETARDFDDAVALRREDDGSFRLWVCIADVAHYVASDSPLDREARERGTSVYFPGFCLPMLPEALSNGICSLNPDAERLVMAVELHFDRTGEVLEEHFYPAVMRSRARLTYAGVAACLAGAEIHKADAGLSAQLREMAELASALTAMRRRRGSLELDLAAVEILLDDNGRPTGLVRAERNPAHLIIEEFMLAANEAVARFLRRNGWNFLYRIHERPDPDRLEDFRQLAAACGCGALPEGNLQQALQQLLAAAAERPEGRLLNQQLLRSLQQARYSPHNSGHFGLAADCYCHFTSPIRRYPDLCVHRVLKLALGGAATGAGPGLCALEALGRECSARERRALEAERDLIQLRCCQVIADRVGEEFVGTVSAVTEFGFFVEPDDLPLEGLVHVRTLERDDFHFDPTTLTLSGQRRRRSYRVGMRVRVRLTKVETWRRRIDFSLVATL